MRDVSSYRVLGPIFIILLAVMILDYTEVIFAIGVKKFRNKVVERQVKRSELPHPIEGTYISKFDADFPLMVVWIIKKDKIIQIDVQGGIKSFSFKLKEDNTLSIYNPLDKAYSVVYQLKDNELSPKPALNTSSCYVKVDDKIRTYNQGYKLLKKEQEKRIEESL